MSKITTLTGRMVSQVMASTTGLLWLIGIILTGSDGSGEMFGLATQDILFVKQTFLSEILLYLFMEHIY